mgnify:CR=1 FL=1
MNKIWGEIRDFFSEKVGFTTSSGLLFKKRNKVFLSLSDIQTKYTRSHEN